MCGGQLFILPCSRVGHISKAQNLNKPALEKALSWNLLRVVHVWLDEYKVSDTSDLGAGSGLLSRLCHLSRSKLYSFLLVN